MSVQAELFASDVFGMSARASSADAAASVPLYIGCAGWSLAASVQHNFPLGGTHLERYSRVFAAVEINSSFYRSHRETTYARWRDSVPDTFRFSVKVPRSITHHSRLQNTESEMRQFLHAAHNLEHKLGCLLVQLPPKLEFEPAVARKFFDELRSSVVSDIACEPRHLTWAAPEADEIFSQFSVARVDADPQVVPMPAPASYTETVYIRLHGTPVIYHSRYSDDYLTQMAVKLADHAGRGRRVWCILDNTASGAAIPNALSLTECANSKVKLSGR